MAESPVLYHKHDSIVTLTLNRPETLNAMNEAMMAELERLLIAVEADTTVRAVVLTGAGLTVKADGPGDHGVISRRPRPCRLCSAG